MAGPILRTESVTVERDGRHLVSDVTLTVEEDERLLIRGPSGAGKTTLFHVLGLLLPPSSGRIFVDGTDASGLPERRRARLRRDSIGIIFQDFHLVPDLTARENAALPQEHAGDRDDDWLDDVFDRLRIADQADQFPATLSGGEKQRVAIARALANRPDVLLADEPIGHLDPETGDRVLELLLSLQADTRTSLVVISHDRSIGAHFQSIRQLRDGRLD